MQSIPERSKATRDCQSNWNNLVQSDNMITIQDFEGGNDNIEVLADDEIHPERYQLFLQDELRYHKSTSRQFDKTHREEEVCYPPKPKPSSRRDQNNSPLCVGEFPESDAFAIPNGGINANNKMPSSISNKLDDIESFREEMEPDELIVNAASDTSQASMSKKIRVSLPRPRQRLPTIFEVVSISIDSGEFSLIGDVLSEPKACHNALENTTDSFQEPSTANKDYAAGHHCESDKERRKIIISTDVSNQNSFGFKVSEKKSISNHKSNGDSSSDGGGNHTGRIKHFSSSECVQSPPDMESAPYSESDCQFEDAINKSFTSDSMQAEISLLQTNDDPLPSRESGEGSCDHEKNRNNSSLNIHGLKEGAAIHESRESSIEKKTVEECCDVPYYHKWEIDENLSQDAIEIQDSFHPTQVVEGVVPFSTSKHKLIFEDKGGCECSNKDLLKDDDIFESEICSSETESIEDYNCDFKGSMKIDGKLSRDCIKVQHMMSARSNKSAQEAEYTETRLVYQEVNFDKCTQTFGNMTDENITCDRSSGCDFETTRNIEMRASWSKDAVEIQDMIPLISSDDRSSCCAEGSVISRHQRDGNSKSVDLRREGEERSVQFLRRAVARANTNVEYETDELEKQLESTQQYADEISALRRDQENLQTQLKLEQREISLQNTQLQADIDRLAHIKMELQASRAEVVREEMELERLVKKQKNRIKELNAEKEKLQDTMETMAHEASEVKEITRKLVSDLHQQKKNVQSQLQREVDAVKAEMEQMKNHHQNDMSTLLKEKEALRKIMEKEHHAIEESTTSMKASLESLRRDRMKVEQNLQFEIDSAKLSLKERGAELREELNRAKFSKTLHNKKALKGHWTDAVKCIKLDAIGNAGEFSKATFRAIMEPFDDDALIKTASVKK